MVRSPNARNCAYSTLLVLFIWGIHIILMPVYFHLLHIVAHHCIVSHANRHSCLRYVILSLSGLNLSSKLSHSLLPTLGK